MEPSAPVSSQLHPIDADHAIVDKVEDQGEHEEDAARAAAIPQFSS